MRIEDRIQALQRSNQYLIDYEKLQEKDRGTIVGTGKQIFILPLTDAAFAFCQKYQIPVPISKPQNIPYYIIPAVIEQPYMMLNGKPEWGIDEINRLFVSIDMTRNRDDILESVTAYYKKYSSQIEMIKERETVSEVRCGDKMLTHWQVYDLITYEKKTKAQITKELVGTNKAIHSGHEGLKSTYDAVGYAYRKACKQIRQAEAPPMLKRKTKPIYKVVRKETAP